MGRFGIRTEALFNYLPSLYILMLCHIDSSEFAISREVIASLDSTFQALLGIVNPLELMLDMTNEVPDSRVVGIDVCYPLVVPESLFRLLAFQGNIAQNCIDDGLFYPIWLQYLRLVEESLRLINAWPPLFLHQEFSQ